MGEFKQGYTRTIGPRLCKMATLGFEAHVAGGAGAAAAVKRGRGRATGQAGGERRRGSTAGELGAKRPRGHRGGFPFLAR